MNIDIEDEAFNAIYPERIRNLAKRHWTPVAVAKQAAEFLTCNHSAKVLDIGSGAGKFCFVGSAYTKGHFTGVEQRENLYRLSNQISQYHNLQNVEFIHSNITKIKFSNYNAFYFYNSFYENIDKSSMIDETVELSNQLYKLYFQYVSEQLKEMPAGTRLVTYWGELIQIPLSYKVVSACFNGRLKMWLKEF